MTSPQEETSVLAFHQALDQHKLVAGRCRGCHALHVPPRPLCPTCGAMDVSLEELSGSGRIAGFTAIYVVPTFMLKEGFGRDFPYLTGIIVLDEGVRLAARITGMDARTPDLSMIGTRVQAAFLDRNEGGKVKAWLTFAPAGPDSHV